MGIGAAAAGVAAAATIGSAVIGSSSQASATSAQQSSDKAAVAQQQAQLKQEQQNAAPYLESGSGALAQLNSLYGISTPASAPANAAAAGFAANQGGATGSYTNAAGGSSTVNPNASFYLSPDYNFALTQGLKGLTAQGAATNGTANGATQKAEIAYAGNLASSNYDSYKQGLLSLAGLGSSATGYANNAESNTSSNISSTDQTQGSDLASGILGQGSEYGKLLTTGASSFSNLASNYGSTASEPQF